MAQEDGALHFRLPARAGRLQGKAVWGLGPVPGRKREPRGVVARVPQKPAPRAVPEAHCGQQGGGRSAGPGEMDSILYIFV